MELLDFPDRKELLARCRSKESVGFQVSPVCPVFQETEVLPGPQASDHRDHQERRASRECQAVLEVLVPLVLKVNLVSPSQKRDFRDPEVWTASLASQVPQDPQVNLDSLVSLGYQEPRETQVFLELDFLGLLVLKVSRVSLVSLEHPEDQVDQE